MKIAFLGDIALIGKYDVTVNKNAEKRIALLANKLKEYDYVVANLESPLTHKLSSLFPKSMHLRSAPENIKLLKKLNINAVSLANNHIYDFGKKGLNDTIKILDANDIEWFGVHQKDLIKNIDGEKISFGGYCCYSTNGYGYTEGYRRRGINTLTLNALKKRLLQDQKNDSFSIFSIHWGEEHTNYPNLEHINLVKKVSTQGKFLIHGHHTHTIQGIQKDGDSLISYSQGNCLFDDCTSINGKLHLKQNSENKRSFILDVEIEDGEISEYKTVGFIDKDEGIFFEDLNPEIEAFSMALSSLDDVNQYNKRRENQIKRTMKSKFGKRDIYWLASRLNYYSIGARLSAILRKKKYLKEIKKWNS